MAGLLRSRLHFARARSAYRARRRTVLKQPETRANLAKVGVALFEDNQANFIKFLPPDIEKWRNLVKSTNLKLE